MEEILILINTSKGFKVDTIHCEKDTTIIQISNTSTLVVPNEPIRIIQEPKPQVEIFSFWAVIIGGLAGIAGAFISIYQLFKKDKDKQMQLFALNGQLNALNNQNENISQQTKEISEQTAQLRLQTKQNERKLRMQIRPIIIIENIVSNNILEIDLKNVGKLCYFKDITIIDGFKIAFEHPNKLKEIETDHEISVKAKISNFKSITSTIKISLYDMEYSECYTIIEISNGNIRLKEPLIYVE